MKNKARKTSSVKYCKAIKPFAAVASLFTKLLFAAAIFQTAIFAQEIFNLPAPGLFSERSLGQNEKHVYHIGLKENELAQVRVEQFGANVNLSAFDPTGKLILKSESRNAALGLEAVSVVAAEAGVYRFEVAATRAPDGGEGKYRITLAILREASAADLELPETERVFMAAMRSTNGNENGSKAANNKNVSNSPKAAAAADCPTGTLSVKEFKDKGKDYEGCSVTVQGKLWEVKTDVATLIDTSDRTDYNGALFIGGNFTDGRYSDIQMKISKMKIDQQYDKLPVVTFTGSVETVSGYTSIKNAVLTN